MTAAHSQRFCLKWDSFESTLTRAFDSLREANELTDITLCCRGARVETHQVVLSACSPYFRDIIRRERCHKMAFFLQDVDGGVLRALVDFMYRGRVNIEQHLLDHFLRTAETLQISGLSVKEQEQVESVVDSNLSSCSALAAVGSGDDEDVRDDQVVSHDLAVDRAGSDVVSAAECPEPPPHRGDCADGAASKLAVTTSTSTSSVTSSGNEATSASLLEAAVVGEKRSLSECEWFASDAGPSCALDSMPLPAPGQLNVDRLKTEPDWPPACDVTMTSHISAPQLAEVSLAAPFSISSLPSTHPAPARGGSGGGGEAAPSLTCAQCGKQYGSRVSLLHHEKMHKGMTRCRLCGKVSSTVAHLRRHLAANHSLTQEQIESIVPRRCPSFYFNSLRNNSG